MAAGRREGSRGEIGGLREDTEASRRLGGSPAGRFRLRLQWRRDRGGSVERQSCVGFLFVSLCFSLRGERTLPPGQQAMANAVERNASVAVERGGMESREGVDGLFVKIAGKRQGGRL